MPRPFNPNTYHGFRISVLRRDKYTCQICGAKEKLEVHHVEATSLNQDARLDISNGLTLCNPCHKKTDSYGGKANKGRSRSAW